MTTDAKTTYQGALRNTHAAEAQGLQQMQRQVGSLDDYPEYKAIIERHIATTEQQLARIEGALEETGTSASTAKEAVTGTAGNVGAAVHGLFSDAQLKNLYAGYAYQYEQIAAYTSLAVIARAAGFPQHASWIEQSIAEEERAADEVKRIIAPVTERYLGLTVIA